MQGIVLARFLGDPVWWLYLVWLPLYLSRARGLSLKAIGVTAWIPFLCADAGALARGMVFRMADWARLEAGSRPGTAILLAAALTPVGMLIAGAKSEAGAVALISVVLFAFPVLGEQRPDAGQRFLPQRIGRLDIGAGRARARVWEP